MDEKDIKNRMIFIENRLRELAPRTIKKSSLDVDYAVASGQYAALESEHNILHAILGLMRRIG